MSLLELPARWVLREELDLLRGHAAMARRFFKSWRSAAVLWEQYAHHLEEKHNLDDDFGVFFSELSAEERDDPTPSDYVPGVYPKKDQERE